SPLSYACHFLVLLFLFNRLLPTEIYPLSLHDALPISVPARARPAVGHRDRLHPDRPGAARLRHGLGRGRRAGRGPEACRSRRRRSEEHTSELQSRENLVCRLLLEKKNTIMNDAPEQTE